MNISELPDNYTLDDLKAVTEAREAYFYATGQLTPRFPCKDCSQRFIKKSQIDRHRRDEHGVLPPQCDYCRRTFLTSTGLKAHVRKEHTGERPFVCHVCQKGYVRSSELRIHMQYHNRESVFECVRCHCKFQRQNSLCLHMKTCDAGLSVAVNDTLKAVSAKRSRTESQHDASTSSADLVQEREVASNEVPNVETRENTVEQAHQSR